jgi:hypothetical protein
VQATHKIFREFLCVGVSLVEVTGELTIDDHCLDIAPFLALALGAGQVLGDVDSCLRNESSSRWPGSNSAYSSDTHLLQVLHLFIQDRRDEVDI